MPAIVEKVLAWVKALGFTSQLRYAERRRDLAFLELSWTVKRATAKDAEAEVLLGRVQRREAARAAIEPMLPASLAADRQDYGRVHGLVKATVIARGILDRQVLRHRIRLLHREAKADLIGQGELILAGRLTVSSSSTNFEGARRDALLADERRKGINERRLQCLEILGGRLFPRWMEIIAGEIVEIGRAITREISSRWIPRASGLAGMGAGWLIAKSFTASRFAGLLDGFGLYRGNAMIVSRESFERINFWGPLVAAAICSYAAARIGRLIQKRYGTQGAGADAGPELESTAATQIGRL